MDTGEPERPLPAGTVPWAEVSSRRRAWRGKAQHRTGKDSGQIGWSSGLPPGEDLSQGRL